MLVMEEWCDDRVVDRLWSAVSGWIENLAYHNSFDTLVQNGVARVLRRLGVGRHLFSSKRSRG